MLEYSSPFRALVAAGSAAAALALAPAPGLALDDFEVTRLQQDFQQLQQKTLQLELRIESLERQLAEARAGAPALGGRPAPAAGTTGSAAGAANAAATTGASRSAPQPPWLNLLVWDRVLPGMQESEVLQLLGVPNSLRKSEDGRSLLMLYALELGSGGFLGGSVRLSDRRVVEVLKPTLK